MKSNRVEELSWKKLQELKNMTPENLMKIEWLEKEVAKNSLEDLKPYNPAIESILGLIKGTKQLSSDPKTTETLNNFEYLLKKEKTFALINKYEKEHTKVAQES